MAQRQQFTSPLEATLVKMKKKEQSPLGRLQCRGHQWLARLEVNPFLLSYGSLLKRPLGLTSLRSDPSIDLDSLFLLSLLFHLLVFFLLTRITIFPTPVEKPEPILVRILDLGVPAPATKERPKKGSGKIARPQPRLSATPATPEQTSTIPPAVPVSPLPAPKVLAEAPSEKEIGFTGQPAESLIQLPTRQSAVGQGSLATRIDPLPSSLAGGGVDAKRSGAGGSGGIAALSSPDFGPYLRMIERRVKSVWQYPEGISGIHQVYLRFALDRAGNLVRVEVVDSKDSRLSKSAVEAMKRASPFPPIPESLKSLAGEDLGFKFTIDIKVKGAQ